MTPRADAPRLFKDQWSRVYLIGWHGQLAFHAHHVCCMFVIWWYVTIMLWYDDMLRLCCDMMICYNYVMIWWYVTIMLWYDDMLRLCYDIPWCFWWTLVFVFVVFLLAYLFVLPYWAFSSPPLLSFQVANRFSLWHAWWREEFYHHGVYGVG